MKSDYITSWQIYGEQWKQWQTLFSWAPKSLQMVTAAMKLKTLAPWKKNYEKPRQYIKKQRHNFANKVLDTQRYDFSSSHVWVWELDHKEVWMQKIENPLVIKEIKQVNPKRNQSWIFFRRTDAEAEAPILWPPDAKSQLIREDNDAGKHWRKDNKGTTEDEKVGWYHWLNGQSLSKLWELVKEKEAWHAAVHGIAKSQTWLSDWMTERQQ